MHRNDLAVDYSLIWTMAGFKVVAAIMRVKGDTEDLTETCPQLYLHAGLIYLQELAQDDNGMQREMTMFDAAAQNSAIAWSLANVTPIAERG